MQKPIYLDNHATTPLDPRVFEAMLPYLRHECGNAASGTHVYGWNAKAAVDKARASVASLIGAHPDEIVFTSGATESNNWALLGTLGQGDHAISTTFEHRSVLGCLDHLKQKGVVSSLVPPRSDGQVEPRELASFVTGQTKIVSVMMANNEIGAVLPVTAIGEMAKERGLLFHCDAVQAAGKVSVNVGEVNADFMSLSAHKMYGPKGVGALYIRRESQKKITPLLHGGGHEAGLRAGTLNVPGIVGFGAAADLALSEMAEESSRIRAMRDRIWNTLRQSISGIKLNGSMENRLSGNLNISFEGVDGEALLLAVQNDIAISASSACSSTGRKVSHVLSAIGIPSSLIQASFRIGIGRFNTDNDIDVAAKVLCIAHASARC